MVAPTEVSAKEAATLQKSLLKWQPPQRFLPEEPAASLATISSPPEQHEEKGKGEAPCSGFPGWMEVQHPAQLVTSARQTLLTLSELRQRHLQPEYRREEGPASKSRRMETNHTGKIGSNSHHQGPPHPCQRLHCPLASRKFQPACRGIHPCWLPVETCLEIRQPDMLMEPMVTMMYATHLVQDEATRAYLHGHCDHLSWGEWPSGTPHIAENPLRTYCGGHHQPPLRSKADDCPEME